MLSDYEIPFSVPPISLTKIKLSFKERGRTGASGIPGDAEKSSNCTHKPHTEAIFEFNIFVTKKDGGKRPVVNLKELNKNISIPYQYF